jgi:flagellar biosynthesis chaperone FliJ
LNPDLRRRAARIVDARQRAVDLAQAELATLTHRTRDANEAAERARTALMDRMASRSPTECSSHDMALEYGYVSMLAKQANRLAAEARDALAAEERARVKVRTAKTEHRKVEIWRDRRIEAARRAEARSEQRESDEVAARISRGT